MNAQQTYAKIQKETLSGRDIEVRVLRKAAAQLSQLLDTRPGAEQSRLLDAAVRYNLRVWDVFHADWDRSDCPLDLPLRTDLLRLSVYMHKTSLEVLAYAAPEKIRSLVSINECLAEGLAAGARAAMPAMALV